MGYRVQYRRDTAARWAEINPILLDGEIGYVKDNPNQYKMGDGVHRWNDLPLRGFNGTIAPTLGYNDDAVLSQRIVTEKFEEQNEKISDLGQETDELGKSADALKYNIQHLNDRILTMETDEEGFSLVDESGNINAHICNDGTITTQNFNSKDVTEKLDNNAKAISKFESNSLAKKTVENGLFVTDENGKVAFGRNFMITEEDGEYITDRDGNIVEQRIGNVTDFAKIGSNAKGLITEPVNIDNTKQSILQNISYGELKRLRDETANLVDSLIDLQKMSPTKSIEITTPAFPSDMDDVVLRLGLHYGSPIGNHTWDEVFFDGDCKTNFSDIRVKNANGKILNHRLIHSGNYEVVKDQNFISNQPLYKDSMNRIYEIRSQVLQRTSDCGETWESITNATSGYSLEFIDSRDYIYIRNIGIIYMLQPDVYGNYDFDGKIKVLDLRVTNGQTNVDPIISLNGREETSEGYIFFGQYQLNYNPVIWRSVNADMTPDGNGNYFKAVYSQTVYDKDGNTGVYSACFLSSSEANTYGGGVVDAELTDQHCHNLYSYYDENSGKNTIYASFDNSTSDYGPRVFKSSDNGNSWSQVTIDDYWAADRSKDYTPKYISSDGTWALGGGETGILGGYTIKKLTLSKQNGTLVEQSAEPALLSGGDAIRDMKAFDDNFIITGVLGLGGGNCTAKILLTEDKGKTWKSIWHCESWNESYVDSSGIGVRWMTKPFIPVGESEPQIFVSGQTSIIPITRVFRGGKHYYGEIYVPIGSVKRGETVTLTVENNYAMAMPYSDIYNRFVMVEPILHLPLNEGVGNRVYDTDGNEYSINGSYQWDKFENGFGLAPFNPIISTYKEMNGLNLAMGASIKLGRLSQLDFNKGFSLVCAVRIKGVYRTYSYRYSPVLYTHSGLKIGLTKDAWFAGSQNNIAMVARAGMLFRDYAYYCVTVSADSVPSLVSFGFGRKKDSAMQTASVWEYNKLSEEDLYVGSPLIDNSPNYRFVNDDQYYFSNIMIFDKVLSRDEFLSIVYGKSINKNMFNN